MEKTERDGPMASIREMHDMERRIITSINDLAIKMEVCVQPLTVTVNEAIRASDRADRKAAAAHNRIDDQQRALLVGLLGWLVTALGGGWGVWRLFQEVQRLQ